MNGYLYKMNKSFVYKQLGYELFTLVFFTAFFIRNDYCITLEEVSQKGFGPYHIFKSYPIQFELGNNSTLKLRSFPGDGN